MDNFHKIEETTEEQWGKVNPKNKQIVEEFLKQSTQLSDKTLKQYRSALQIYFWYIFENLGDKNFFEIKPRDFLAFQNWLVSLNLSSSAIRFKRSAVSTLNNYIETYWIDEYKGFRNYVNKSIALPPKAFVNEKKPLTLDEYKNLCDQLEKAEMYQQLAYVEFSFSSGARRAEVGQLLKEVINYEPKIITKDGKETVSYNSNSIRCKGRGKIGKVRKLQFDQKSMDAIKKWLSIRGDDDCPYVFATKKNDKYSKVNEATFNLWSEKYFEPIVGRRFHPHLLRETRATTMVVEQGKDINVAKKLLGHELSETTQIYVIRDDENDWMMRSRK